MKTITVDLGNRSYPIYIGARLISQSRYYSELLHTDQVMVVTDTNVEAHYLSSVLDALKDFKVISHVFAPGEQYKNLQKFNEIITVLLERRFARTSCLVALGGGVIGDLTGFAAACYQRGIQYLQAPTTLLAQVDSSVGGKTAVNHPLGKNMIGAFHQPCGVLTDVSVLSTLPDREFRAGIAEVIKYGLIRDPDFFNWLESNLVELMQLRPDSLEHAIERSCINKAEVVAEDETEKGLRAILNLGHTFGHAIETALEYSHWLHGEAVGLGMLMASHMSLLQGWLSESDNQRIFNLVEGAGLPVCLPEKLSDSDLRELMSVDKKVSHGRLKLVLLKSIGEAVITDDFDEKNLSQTIQAFRNKG